MLVGVVLMPKCHCDKKLTKKKPFKGRKNVYLCKFCGCTYAFTLVIRSVDCSKKLIKPNQTKTLGELRKERKRKKRVKKKK